MPRARNIKPSFFKNEDLAQCAHGARLVFVGLWTMADRDGRLEDRPMRIKAELFPYENCDMEAWLNQLANFNFINRYETDGRKYIQITAFKRHQNPHVHEPASTIPAPCENGTSTSPARLIPDSLLLIPDSGFLIPDSPLPLKAGGESPQVETGSKKKRSKFERPTVQEVAAYCIERKNSVDAQAFMDHYDSVGWKCGKGSKPMSDWKAAIRSVWEKKNGKVSRLPTPEDDANWNPVDGGLSQ